MKKISSAIILILLCFTGIGCDSESKRAISKYSGDGRIKHLPSPGILGIDGIEIKFSDIDLSQDFKTQYGLQNLPPGSPYMVYFVVPEPAPLNEIMKNQLQLNIYKNGELVRTLSMEIGQMINNQVKNLNRFYSLKGHRGHSETIEIISSPDQMFSIEFIYENTHVSRKATGYLLLERGGFK